MLRAAFLVLMLLAPAVQAASLRTMTFNIREAGMDRGTRHWSARAAKVAEVIERQAPDVVGLQEATPPQVADLLAALPDYAAVGDTTNGRKRGATNSVLFRRARFVVDRAETVWLSATPHIASRAWSGKEFRTATFITLIDESGPVVFVNAHLSARRVGDRIEAAKLLARLMPTDGRLVLLGDLNATPGAPELAPLFTTGLADTEPTGWSFHGWRLGEPGKRLDYVLARGLELRAVRVVREAADASDHLPIVAEFGGAP